MPTEPKIPREPGGAGGSTQGPDPIQRIEAALARIGAEHEPPAGWEARVLAATEPPRRSRWPRWTAWIALPAALAAAAALVVAVMPEQTSALQLALEIEPSPVAVRSRGTDPQIGDRVRATATGGGSHRGVWIYHNESKLVIACPGPASCQRTDTTVTAETTLGTIGTYQIIVLAASAPLPTPTGRFDVDAAAAEQANVTISRQDLTVR